MTDWKELIGKRVLIKEKLPSYSIIEATVVEVSPSGNYVKFKFGNMYDWHKADEFEVVEVLGYDYSMIKTVW